jgi:hypothetical protein
MFIRAPSDKQSALSVVYRAKSSVPGMGDLEPRQARRMSLAEQHDCWKSRHSRRAVLRGGLAGASVLAAAPALLGATAADAAVTRRGADLIQRAERVDGATVAPFGRHLGFGADPGTEMSVTWQVPHLVDDPFIRIGADPAHLGERIPVHLEELLTPATNVNEPAAQYYLRAALSGLAPGRCTRRTATAATSAGSRFPATGRPRARSSTRSSTATSA